MAKSVNKTLSIIDTDRVKAWAIANKITLIEVAERIGTRKGTLCNAMCGASGLNPEIYAKLMDLINDSGR